MLHANTKHRAVILICGLFQNVIRPIQGEDCLNWPNGWPREHQHSTCENQDRMSRPSAKSILLHKLPETIAEYLSIPEETTRVCPLDDDSVDSVDEKSPVLGHATKWVLYNHASTPVIISSPQTSPTNGADTLYPKEMKSAVYPNGPVILPGDIAVVNGFQGQLFTVREYKEDHGLFSATNHEHEYSESFMNALPPTWSFAANRTRYTTKKSVTHVLGNVGRVLMKHRMGMIHIKSEFGALCPEPRNNEETENVQDNVRALEKSQDDIPDCNVLRKGIINKVGCPIDLYYAPPKADMDSTASCEHYTDHLGAIDEFVFSSESDLDSFDSPIIHRNTYNSHSFVARMSHDQSFVARINIDHDVVYDCPEQRRPKYSDQIIVDERLIGLIPLIQHANFTEKSRLNFVAENKAGVFNREVKRETDLKNDMATQCFNHAVTHRSF